MKRIALVYEITNNPYFDTSVEEYSNRISEFVYPSEINDLCNTFKRLGYEYDMVDGAKGLMEIIRSSRKYDLIFNKSIGFKGLERKIVVPAICQTYNLNRVGSGAYAMTLARHKYHTNCLLRGLGFNVPFAYLYFPGDDIPSIDKFPVIVKPNEESDSLGISNESICNSYEEMINAMVSLIKDFNQPIIIEEYIPGEEWKVAVIGNKGNTRAYGCVNSLKNGKPMNGTLQTRDDIINDTLSFVPVVHHLRNDAMIMSAQIHDLLNLNDYSRCDFRIGNDGLLYCMEISTHPEISKNNSSFISGAMETLLDYESVIGEILLSATKRYSI